MVMLSLATEFPYQSAENHLRLTKYVLIGSQN